MAVLGHVDHGKTSLLDVIRETNQVKREAGGITQSIGASQVTTKDKKKITFIDTPGHAAFSAMRSRGAEVADIALLVVAAESGVKPQTVEALRHIKEAGIPYIVVINKIDLPSASPETVVGQLEKEGVLFEGSGGNTPKVNVSAKERRGIDSLLELIILVFETSKQKAETKNIFQAVVIETSKDRKGPLVSVVIKSGKLSVADEIASGDTKAKVRAIFDVNSKSVKEILPGDPAMILGFSKLPSVGSVIQKTEEGASTKVSKLEGTKALKKDKEQVGIVLKAKDTGVLEAILASLPKESFVVSSSVGELSENDVFLAKSGKAKIFVFESKTPPSALKLAETEDVEVESFKIIYKLIEAVVEYVERDKEQEKGRANILASFPFSKKQVAGAKLVSGSISKGDSLVLLRGDQEIGRAKAVSLRILKNEISNVKAGEEFGVIMNPQLDFAKGDVILSVEIKS